MPTATPKRRKRFKRKEGDEVPNIVLVPDDYEIFLHVLRRRLVTSEQVRALFPHRSQQKLTRRFSKLFDNGLLDKPEPQVSLFRRGEGSPLHVLASTKAGVDAVNAYYHLDIPYSRWARRNENLRPQSIEHMLGTSDFMVKLEVSARQYDHLTTADAFGILSEQADRRYDRPKPLAFATSVEWCGETSQRGIEPDELLRIHYRNAPEGRNMANFAVEIDRGTETLEPRGDVQRSEAFFRSSSILKKFVIYANAWKERAMLEPFGFKTFRVLLMTTTPKHMRRAQQVATKYLPAMGMTRPGFILFSNQEVAAKHADNFLSAPWETQNGKTVYIDGIAR